MDQSKQQHGSGSIKGTRRKLTTVSSFLKRLKFGVNIDSLFQIGAFEAALKSVENVLRVQPQNVKALFRKGKVMCTSRSMNSFRVVLSSVVTISFQILASMGKTNEAIQIMKEALKIEPETKVKFEFLASRRLL